MSQRDGNGAVSPQIAKECRCSQRAFFSHQREKSRAREMVDESGQYSGDVQTQEELPGSLAFSGPVKWNRRNGIFFFSLTRFLLLGCITDRHVTFRKENNVSAQISPVPQDRS